MAGVELPLLSTPGQLFDGSAEAPLALELTCNRCGLGYSGKFDWACVTPKHGPEDEDWDGVLLSRIVECAGCGAVDDYTLAAGSLLLLTGGVLRSRGGTTGKSRIIFGVSQLWDGSVARRPSQALARLRQLAVEHPNRAEAFRRLGNGCERWGLMEEAVASWKKALDLDPAEIEATYSLARYWWGEGERPAEGFAYLRQGLQTLPKVVALKPESRQWGAQLVWLLREVVERCTEPIALMAVWSEGAVNDQPVVTMSSVDLGKVDFERLAEFVARPDLLALDLTPELPEEEPTILQRLLAGNARATLNEMPVASRSQPTHAQKAVGRNAPCPCGSGQKYKRCCGS